MCGESAVNDRFTANQIVIKIKTNNHGNEADVVFLQ